MIVDSRKQAQQIIVEIIRQSADPFEGKTRLYEAFYLSHLFYYLDSDSLLSDWPIVHMTHGPGIDEGEQLLAELSASGIIETKHGLKGPYPEERYQLLTGEPSPLNRDECDAIRKSVAFMSGMTGAELSTLLHDRSFSWNHGKPGDQLNIYLDLFTKEQRHRERLRNERLQKVISTVFR